MKKVLMIILLSLLLISSVFSVQIRINPYGNFANIDMASTNYKAISDDFSIPDNGVISSSNSEKPLWVEITNGDISVENGTYTNFQMIGMGFLDGMKSEVDYYATWHRGISNRGYEFALIKPITITITCPYGYNFVSQGSPEYKRPFKLVLSGMVADNNNNGDNNNRFSFVFDETHQSYTITPEMFKTIIPSSRRFDNESMYIWFDLVLVLPGEVSNTGNLDINGNNYPLKNTDDYAAVVTFSVKIDGESNSMTIPFSGYYFSQGKEAKNFVSLSISPTARASNINLNTEAGIPLKVADIMFMMDVTPINEKTGYALYDTNNGFDKNKTFEDVEKILKGENKYTNIQIFFSANNAPGIPDSEGFKLVHTSVNADAPKTNYNSASFKVITEAKPGRSLIHRKDTEVVVAGEMGGLETIEFDGKDFAFESGGTTTVYNTNVNNEGTSIKPDLFVFSPRSNFDSKSVRYYYAWEGEIYVEVDSNIQPEIMLAGRYLSTIYVHVVAD